jgi:hypothetical protein
MIQCFISMCLFYFALSISIWAADTKAPQFKNIDQLIAQNKLDQVLPQIEKDLSEAPQNLEWLMRKSRVITLLGDQAKKDADKIKHYEEGQKIADNMISINPQSAKGYLRRAVAKGKLILFKGALESRSNILELKSDAEKVLALDGASTYEKGLANYLLARVHLKLADTPKAIRLPLGLAWANKAEGGRLLKTAVELSPQSIPFNLDYAIWLKENGDIETSKQRLVAIEKLDIYDPADIEHKSTAQKILRELNE